ncbi:MAG: cation diffusion facilitator family transporter [Ilumatobacteraceae bacterium]
MAILIHAQWRKTVNQGSRRAIYAAFAANLGIAIAKLIGAIITGSAGLLAETFHSLADTGNQALLLVGGRRAERKASEEHPFGYGSERYFWSFVVALVLFSLGGLFALFEGVQKLRDPHEASHLRLAVFILIVAIVLESISLRTAVREAKHSKPSDESWWSYIRKSKEPELPVVLLEDIGAEIGLIFALIGVIVASVTGNSRWDALGSLAIGVLLIAIAYVLAVKMKSLLIGEAATSEVQQHVTAALIGHPDVIRIIHMRTLHLGPDEILLAVKIEFNRQLSVTQLAKAIDDAEVRARDAIHQRLVIYIEPDIMDTSRTL